MKKLEIPKISVETIKYSLQSMERKTLVRIGIVTCGFLAFFLFFFLPVYIHNQNVGSEVKKYKDRVAQANIKIAKIPVMIKQKEQFGARIKKIREEFFDFQDSDKLIEAVSNFAKDSGVNIVASRPSPKIIELPPPFDKKYTSISYDLVVHGNYHAIGSFINKLESYAKTFAVHEVRITESEKAGAYREATLTLTAFIKQVMAP